jgi:hypothetical protein
MILISRCMVFRWKDMKASPLLFCRMRSLIELLLQMRLIIGFTIAVIVVIIVVAIVRATQK